MKRGKTLEIKSFRDYKVKFGSIDDNNSKAVYLNIAAWGQPKLNQELDYNKTVRDFNKRVKRNLYDVLLTNNNISVENPNDLFLKDRTIVDLDIKESGIRFNKRSFLNLEITLFLSTELGLNSKILQPKLNTITNNLINNVFNKDEYFKFFKTKK